MLENELRSFNFDHRKLDRGDLYSESSQEEAIDKSSLVSVAPDLWKPDQTKITKLIEKSD